MPNEAESNIPWKKVLLVGTPLAIAGVAGYYIYKRWHQDENQKLNEPEESKVVDPLQRANELKELGNRNFRARRYDRAVSFYSQAIEVCPPTASEELAIFYQNRAAAYQSNNQEDESLADCNKALEYKSRYIKALSRRGKIYENKGMFQEALEDATASCLFESFSNEENVHRVERVMKVIGERLWKELQDKPAHNPPVLPSPRFIQRFFKSYECDPLQHYPDRPHRNGNAPEVGADVPNGHEGDSNQSAFFPDITLTSLREALCLLHEGDYDNACAKILEVVEELKESDVSVTQREHLLSLLFRGTMYHLAYRSEEALADFNEVIALGEQLLDTSTANVRDIVVNAFIKMGSLSLENTSEAMSYFDRAIQLLPDCSDIYSHRAQQRMTSDDSNPRQTISDFQKAVKLSPNNPVYQGYLQYAQLLNHCRSMNMEEIDRGMNNWDSLLEKYPNCYEIYSLQGQFLNDIGRHDQAVRRFEHALKLQPNSATEVVNLALARMRQESSQNANSGRPIVGSVSVSPEVIQLLRKAIEFEPRSVSAQETMAMVLTQCTDLDGAVHHYEVASHLPHHPKEVANLLALRESLIAQLNIMKRYDISKREMESLRERAMEAMVRKSQADMATRAAGDF